VSDAILDACLEQDPESKVACETCTKTNMVMVFGEITTQANVNYEKIVRDTCRGIGFVSADVGLDADNCKSPDIAQGVHGHLTKKPEDIGAGDQGHMFGYAIDETPELMPLTHVLATKVGAKLTEVRKNKTCPWLRPDGKTQVTVEYQNDNGAMVPIRVHIVLISTQHDETVTNEQIAADLKEHVIKPVIPAKYLDDKTIFHLPPKTQPRNFFKIRSYVLWPTSFVSERRRQRSLVVGARKPPQSVNEGHPDKLCDQVLDAILDACLEQDPESKVACETCTKTNMVMVFGEITTQANVNYEKIVRDTCRGIGFVSADVGLDADNCKSPDIAQGVHGHLTKNPEDIGAGDQGHMFGYAIDETPELMPLTHVLATKVGAKLTEVRKNKTCPWLRPDGKTQVTVEYQNDNGAMVPIRVHTVLISTQHDETVTNEQIAADLKEHVIKPVIPTKYLDDKTIFHLPPKTQPRNFFKIRSYVLWPTSFVSERRRQRSLAVGARKPP
ncbi:hypothetical protein RYX36_023276, partial [Vicia faba]